MEDESRNWFTYYANGGISVLPIKTDGTKAPAVSGWAQYQLQIANEGELNSWHKSGFGVGLVCGDVSGGLEVIDIDEPSLSRPFYLAIKEESPSILDSVAFIATPRKDKDGLSGIHVVYRCEKPAGNQKLALSEPEKQFNEDGTELLNPVTNEPVFKTRTLIETRGQGGYVVSVGSPRPCHPSGNLYEQKAGCPIPELQAISEKDRNILLKIAKSFDRSAVVVHQATEFERDEESPGNKYAQSTSWEEILTPHGWSIDGHGKGVVHWRRPGKQRGYSATTGLKSTAGSDLLCVFSTNADPFPGPAAGAACSTHSKFDAYARLNFHGDHSEAARHLSRQGFGKQREKKTEEVKPIVFATWEQITREYLESIKDGKETTLQTGITALDDMVGGFAFGELIIIGGRPSHGKSLCAFQLADYFSQVGFSSLLISEEMSQPLLSKRRLHMVCDLEEDSWHRNYLNLQEAHDEWSAKRSPVYIAPQCGTIKRAVEVIEKAATEHDIKIIVVDYAQLLRGKGSTRYEQVTDVSQQLREATSRHCLLTIMLCQLNRNSERGDSRPRSIDLRDSGQLEQDADVVLLVDWPKMRSAEGFEWDDYLIYCEKNRNRETRSNSVQLKIEPRRQTIRDTAAQDYEWEPAQTAYKEEW